jgi:hypothetical protein
VKLIVNLVAFTIITLSIGLGSARHMIDRGSALTTVHSGPWTAWYAAGMPDADPYTKAYVARNGMLPIVSTTAMRLVAKTDSAGERLRSRCHYRIAVPEVSALWWSLALYDSSGDTIPNPAERHSFNSKEVIPGRDGTTEIALAPAPRAGYWLPSGADKELTLVFRVFRPFDTADLASGETPSEILPRIERVECA